MSMNLNDVLRTLGQAANASASGSSNTGDPVSDILSGLLGGGTQKPGASQQQTGDSGLGGLLGGLLGGGTPTQSSAAANPLLDPVANLVSQKTGLPPAVASMAVSFAMTQIVSSLANKAQGGASQPGFQHGNLAKHLSNGHPVDAGVLTSSGLAQQFASQSGLDLPTATQALQHTLSAIGPAMAGGSVPNVPVTGASTTKPTGSKPANRKSR